MRPSPQAPVSRTSAAVAVASNANTGIRQCCDKHWHSTTPPKCATMLTLRRIPRPASKSNATTLVGSSATFDTFAARMPPASPSAVPRTMQVRSQRCARWSSQTLTSALTCMVPKRLPACARLMQALASTRNALGALENNASFVTKKQQRCTSAAKTIGTSRLPPSPPRCAKTLSWRHAWTSDATDVGESRASCATRMPSTSRGAVASVRHQAHPASARPVCEASHAAVREFWERSVLGICWACWVQSIDVIQLYNSHARLSLLSHREKSCLADFGCGTETESPLFTSRYFPIHATLAGRSPSHDLGFVSL